MVSMTTTLRGGIADGREVEASGVAHVAIAELLPTTRMATDADEFWLDPFEWVDPELNPQFRLHIYNAASGQFIGIEDRPFVSAHRA